MCDGAPDASCGRRAPGDRDQGQDTKGRPLGVGRMPGFDPTDPLHGPKREVKKSLALGLESGEGVDVQRLVGQREPEGGPPPGVVGVSGGRRLPAVFSLAPCLAAIVAAAAAGGGCRSAGGWGGANGAGAAHAWLHAARAVRVLHQEGRYRFELDGRRTYTHAVRYRVLTEEGVSSWGFLRAGWSPWYQERPEFFAEVVGPDGRTHTLDPDSVVEVPIAGTQGAPGGQRRRLEAHLPGLVVGAVVETRIVQRDRRPYLPGGGGAGRFLFGSRVPVERSRLVLEVPAGLPFDYTVQGFDFEPAVDRGRDRTTVTFELTGLQPVAPARLHLPFEQVRQPQVVFSTAGSWESVARRYHALLESEMEGAERDLVRGLDASLPRREVVSRLLHRVDERVERIRARLGEAPIRPRRPVQTLSERRGDGKDRAVLLIALLREMGIEAHLAVAREGLDRDVSSRAPGLEGFNRALVYLPGPPPLFVDPAAEYAPVGELPARLQGRSALIVRASGGALVRIPEASPMENRYLEQREVHLPPWGRVRVFEQTGASGVIEQLLRAQFARSTPDSVERSLTRYVRNTYGARALGRFGVSVTRDLGQPFAVTAEALEASSGYTGAKEARFQLRNAVLFTWLPDLVRNAALGAAGGDDASDAARAAYRLVQTRRSDFVLPQAYRAEVRYRLHAPSGYVLDPASLSRRDESLGEGRYQVEIEPMKDWTEVTARFVTGPRRMSSASLRALVEGLARLFEEPVGVAKFLHGGARLIQQGKLREGLAEYRRVASKEEGVAYARYAEALLQLGLGDLARREAQRAVETAPEAVFSWSTQGWVLQHDLVGRRYGRGFDRARAIEAYRAVLELDPDDYDARVHLAILLEHGPYGRRYGEGADLVAATREYRRARAASGKREHDGNLMTVLLHQDEFSQLIRLASEAEADDRVRLSLVAVARALSEGVHAAIETLRAADADDEERLGLVSIASVSLMRKGRYDLAAGLTKAAFGWTKEPDTLAEKAEVLERVKPYPRSLVSPDDPRHPVQRLLAGLFSERVAWADVEHLFLSGASPAETRAVEALLDAKHQSNVRSSARSGTDLSIVRDHVVALTELSVEGDASSGYTVVGRLNLGDKTRVDRWFVLPAADGTGYRLAGLDVAPWMLARHIRGMLDRGEVSGAGAWLDRVRTAILRPRRPGLLARPDLLARLPFVGLWTPEVPRTEARARVALEALAAMGPDPSVPPRVLLDARGRATAFDEVTHLDHALVMVYRRAERPRSVLDPAARLLAALPDSPRAFSVWAGAAAACGHLDEVIRRAEARSARDPNDGAAYDALATAHVLRGRYADARRVLKRLIDRKNAGAVIYNNRAWWSLFEGTVTDADLADALRANELTRFSSPDHLHTLAALYAERGKVSEASTVLQRRVGLTGGQQPQPADWFIVGRILERLGLFADARAAYRRVITPDERPEDSTERLARRRLERMGAELRKIP